MQHGLVAPVVMLVLSVSTAHALSQKRLLTVGCYHQCVTSVTDGGVHVVYCWGDNSYGQCGYDSKQHHYIQNQTESQILGFVIASDTAFVSLQAGCIHTCVTSSDGETVCWGSKDGYSSHTPWILGSECTACEKVSVGAFHTCMLGSLQTEGRQECWGFQESVSSPFDEAVVMSVRRSTGATTSPTVTAEPSDTMPPMISQTFTPEHTAAMSSSPFVTPTATVSNTLTSTASTSTTPSQTNSPSSTCSDTSSATQSATPSGSSTPSESVTESQTSSGTWSTTPSSTASHTPSNTPLAKVRMAVVGRDYACALLTDGRVKCWGNNEEGQLGDGTTVMRYSPQAVALNSVLNVSALYVGNTHTCAVAFNGSFACWGSNAGGQTGAPPSAFEPVPVVTDRFSTYAMALGRSHTCVLLYNASYACWGFNNNNQTGQASPEPYIYINTMRFKSSPTNGVHVTQISAGDYHTCVLLSNGRVYCWGYNNDFEYAPAMASLTSVDPVPFRSTMNITAIHAGNDMTCAVYVNHTLRCFGRNTHGRCGYGYESSQVAPSDGAPYTPLWGNVAGINLGNAGVCLRYFNGSISCWGRNNNGTLGYGHSSDLFSPAAAGILPLNVVVDSVVVGGKPAGEPAMQFTCVVTSFGSMRCWGQNNFGNLGYGDTTHRYIARYATDIPGLT